MVPFESAVQKEKKVEKRRREKKKRKWRQGGVKVPGKKTWKVVRRNEAWANYGETRTYIHAVCPAVRPTHLQLH